MKGRYARRGGLSAPCRTGSDMACSGMGVVSEAGCFALGVCDGEALWISCSPASGVSGGNRPVDEDKKLSNQS